MKRKLNLAGVKYINPLPKFFLFTKDPVKTLRERIEETEMKYYTIDELKQIVRHSIDTPFEIRISILIQMFTGCRISELVTIHVDDILFQLHYFESGKIHSFQKTGLVKFVLPTVIMNILSVYLEFHHDKYGSEQKWLFPDPKGVDHIQRKTYRRKLVKYFTQIQGITKTHKYRKTLARYRRVNDTIRSEREFLSNHKLTVVDSHYAVRTIKERKQVYLENIPKKYLEILDLITILEKELKKKV